MNEKTKQYLIQGVGLVAFIVGGIITREKTMEGVETLENFIDKHRSKNEEQ